jgi:hypothetical protein
MNNEGKILEAAVKLHDLTAEKIAAKSDMSKTQLYRLFKRETIDEYSKKCLLRAGINVNELVRLAQIQENSQVESRQRMFVDDLVPTIMMLRDQYKLLQDEYRFISEELKAIKAEVLSNAAKQRKKSKATT